MSTWNLRKVEKELKKSFEDDSEVDLLAILKKNSFLFYPLYSRKYGIQPNFAEVSFAGKMRCDFAWLNDNSGGPEWVLVEIEKPKMKLFSKNGDPSAELNHAVEQVKSWDRYFRENPSEKSRIFGAVSRFKYILVAGSREDWSSEKAIKWRAYHNDNYNIEIRSCDIFLDAIKLANNKFEELWSFEENPISLKDSQLEKYWQEYGYMDIFRKVL
ncbi:Shedu anti-phage system protein SduA domain-containing protein [Algibacter mikhailovii]|uniref:Shedu protein SduA C-terminal domain-containing protein n=1 Tax=Algibacter mikhailovii TaxID=425498 RepID=A0A918VF72_9FLAO|nr:Shedu anti-phage system protein SduA domain-containing protein [Algibacter mikhailovii]GGZ94354.1 hypothetical protein GCM10007028_35870 [Algibacter mikhailovii]